VGFQRLQDMGRRVPALAFSSIESVAMQAGLLGKPSCGNAVLFEGGANPLNEVCDHGAPKSIFWYAIQAQNHTSMCEPFTMRSRMERTADERREILRTFINENGLKIARWAKDSGVDKNSIYNFLNSHSNALDPRTYAKLARTAEVPVWRISGEAPEPPSPTSIWVVGSVEAGAFHEAVEWDRSRWYSVDVPVPERFRRRAKALEVRGFSMDLEYKPGAVVIWVDYLDFRPPRHEDHVIVYAHHEDGTIEATVKELRVDESGKRWLWPRSTKPEHQQPIDTDAPPTGISSIELKGIVIGDYRPRAL
jgi:SOS-response transcriptional repressor LexA